MTPWSVIAALSMPSSLTRLTYSLILFEPSSRLYSVWTRFDKELVGGEDRYYHLVLLAENNVGYENLTKIVSRGHTEGYYYRPPYRNLSSIY